PVDAASVRRNLIFCKTVLNVFAIGDGGVVSAAQYNQWLQDVERFEQACGSTPGGLHGEGGEPIPADYQHGMGVSGGTGGAPEVTTGDVEYALDEISKQRGLMSRPEIRASLAGMEQNLVDRMALREILKDRKLAEKLTPSAALVEQLLRQKGKLSGAALANAKVLIR
ncbi:MAG: VWA containing CoxE family protein, partial [bacterium]|nr:VWA containing CoxE family protein [bacterium]